MFQKLGIKRTPRLVMRVAGTAGAVVLFLSLIWMAGRAGFASLLTAYAAKANLSTSADAAVSISPADPDAHLIRGELLEANDDLTAAIAEYQVAAELRPDDYVLWLML